MHRQISQGRFGRVLTFLAAFYAIFLCQLAFSQEQSSSNEIHLTEEEKLWISENPVIRTSNPTGIAPFIFTKNNGDTDGLVVDYLELIGSKVGLTFEFVGPGPWNQMMDDLRNGKIDLIHSAAQNDERSEYITFSSEYLSFPFVNFGRKGSPRINSAEDLKGKRIGLVSGYVTAARYEQYYPDLDYHYFDNVTDALKGLSASRIDVFTGSIVSGNYSMLQNYIPNLEVIGDDVVLAKDSIEQKFGAVHENKILIDIIQKAIDGITANEFVQISSKWQYSQISNTETNNEFTADEKAWLKEHPVIRVGNPHSLAPFSFTENGELQGIAIDYLKLLSNRTGITFEYAQRQSWPDMLDSLKNGQIDMVHSIVQNDDRSQYITFSSPYLELPFVMMGRVGSDPIQSVDDLKGKRIGLVSGYFTTTEYQRKQPDLTYVEFDTIEDVLRALATSQIDVYPGNLIFTNYTIRQHYIPGLEVIGQDPILDITTYGHRIGVSKNNELLAGIIEKAQSLVSTEEFIRISDNWLNREGGMSVDIGLTADEIKWLSENPVIRVSLDPNLLPLAYVSEEGRIDGITGDYLRLIADMLNVKFEWIGNQTFTEGFERTKNGEADMIALLSPTEDREKFLTFTESYSDISHMIFTRDDGDFFPNIQSLTDKKLAVVKSYDTTEMIAREYPAIELIEVDTVADALKLVSTGEADAHIGGIPVTAYNMAAEAISNISVVGESPFGSGNAMGIRSELPLLASAMQKAMKAITIEQKTRISQNWIALKPAETVDYTLVWQILGGATLIILLFAFWNYKIKEAQQKAEAANVAKSTFLANMSHEIRTPLNAIIGFSDAMLAGLGGEIKNTIHKQYLTDIKESGEHLTTVINDILDLSKIESGKWVLHEETFCLNQCVEEAVKLVAPQAEKKHISINCNPANPIKIKGDTHALRRVLINLLSNALKFTPKNGSVDCEVKFSEKEGIYVNITDTGVGIPSDRLDEVMKPFEQSNMDYGLNEEGTGLGLPIVKNLVELHGGKFALESEVNKGTKASIQLPPDRLVA